MYRCGYGRWTTKIAATAGVGDDAGIHAVGNAHLVYHLHTLRQNGAARCTPFAIPGARGPPAQNGINHPSFFFRFSWNYIMMMDRMAPTSLLLSHTGYLLILFETFFG